jgi:hypothetical protein
MECALTLMTISAGLLLSIACATLIEELFFGGLFRIFFAPRLPQQAKIGLPPHQAKYRLAGGPGPASPQNKHAKQHNR